MKIELLGGTTQEELENRIKRIAAAGKLSRYKGNVFEVLESCDNYENNLKMVKRIIGMGHESIIEHDYLVFAISDVSPIIEQTIIEHRLTSFTIKSRREVDFRNVGFYSPEFRDKDYNKHPDNENIAKEYSEYMKWLFNEYADFVDNGIPREDARFILPYSYYSNIIMGLDARELERMINYMLYGEVSKISECKEFGNKLLEIANDYIPYITSKIKETEKKETKIDMNKLLDKREIKIIEKPQIIDYTKNMDDIILQSSIMYQCQCNREEAEQIIKEAEKENSNFKEDLMQDIMNKEGKRELEQVIMTVQIPISLSILTHLTRHRMHSLLIPSFVPMWNLENYIIPDTMKEKYEEKVKSIFEKNIQMFNKFKQYGIVEEDLVYFYLGGNMCNVVTSMNARTLQWISRMRCCNKAQWQIRNIFKEIVKETKKIAPLLGKYLGPTCETEYACYEGKECCGKIAEVLREKNKK